MTNNLTISGGSFATGKFGQALVLAGGGDGTATSTAHVPASGTFTASVWFKRSGNPSDLSLIITQANAFWIAVNNSGQLQASYGSGSNETSLTTTSSVVDNVWHLAEIVVGSSGATLYFDGAQVATNAKSDTTAGVSRTANYFAIGQFDPAISAGFKFAGSIDEVAILSGDQHATSIPTSARNASSTGILNLWHLDGDGADSAAASAISTTIIDRSNAALLYSPYNWDENGTTRDAITNGAYLRFDFTGTSLALTIGALSGLSVYPTFRAYIDNLPAVDVQVTSGQTLVSFVSGLAAGTHHATILLKGIPLVGRWDRTAALKLVNLQVDNAATVAAPTGPISQRAKRLAWFGDSISEGERVYGPIDPPAGSDAMLAVVSMIAEELGAEYGQIGHGGQGFVQAGVGGVPGFNSAYGYYSNGRSRLTNGLLSPSPDYICCMHGTNGDPVAQIDIATGIANMRSIAPSAWIFMIVPPGGFGRTNITTAANAAITAGDTRIVVVDAGSGSYQAGLNGNNGVVGLGPQNEVSADTIHPNLRTNARLAAKFSALMQHALEPRKYTVVAN